MNRPQKIMHWRDAIALLESGNPVNLKCWKLADGAILEYKNAVCTSHHWRGGTHTVKLPESNLLREFRDITLFEINGYEIIR